MTMVASFGSLTRDFIEAVQVLLKIIKNWKMAEDLIILICEAGKLFL